MDVKELKFILKLLGFPDYRAPISQIKPNPKTKATERDSICRKLSERELVAYTYEVTKLAIAPPGKSLLKVDPAGLPVTAEELKVLQASAKGSITPGETAIPAANRQAVIQGLADRGFIKAVEQKIKEVWLREGGQKYLREEYTPSGTLPLYSGEMLKNYIHFLRKSLGANTLPAIALSKKDSTQKQQPAAVTLTSPRTKPSDEDILQTIRDLDRQLGTENYLPIFHLRQKFQGLMSRKELDRALYSLEQNERITLSSLEELTAYPIEQINGGIPQDIGGPLFFIIVN